MNIKSILVSQPEPKNNKNPYKIINTKEDNLYIFNICAQDEDIIYENYENIMYEILS